MSDPVPILSSSDQSKQIRTFVVAPVQPKDHEHPEPVQRSDPKAGDPAQFPRGRGPQGDVIEIYNMVRPVRGGVATRRESGPPMTTLPDARRPGKALPAGAQPPGFVGRLDRDGKVSRQEFNGPPHAFDRLDADKDGYLIETEAPLAPGRRIYLGPSKWGAAGR